MSVRPGMRISSVALYSLQDTDLVPVPAASMTITREIA
jgi:hypothetical protein